MGEFGRFIATKTLTAVYYLNYQFPPFMSAKIILDNIAVKNNPAKFNDPICFEVTFTSVEPLIYPLNWKVIYVGSALDEDHDQVLD